MKNRCLLAVSLFAASLLGGCASTSMLPQTNTFMALDDDQGNLEMGCYKETVVFNNANKAQVIEAIKAGFKKEGFKPTLVNDAEGIVFGEHGMTLHNLNIIAGLYIEEIGRDARVVIVVRSSKKISFSKESTDAAWSGRILQGMRDYLNQPGI
jgi:hypothetical protein